MTYFFKRTLHICTALALLVGMQANAQPSQPAAAVPQSAQKASPPAQCTNNQCPQTAADPRLPVWEAMNAALIAGNIPTALTFLTESAKKRYERIFQALITQMPSIIGSYSPPLAFAVGADFAEYFVTRPDTVNGAPVTDDTERSVFTIRFLRDLNGNWKIDSM
jgi:hypothetical protein